MRSNVIIDVRIVYDSDELKEMGFKYSRIGKK